MSYAARMSHIVKPSTADRITELRVRGLRTLEDVRLKLGPLTILIGENGAGKSSMAEACVLLGKLGRDSFIDQFTSAHGGFATLLRRGATSIGLGLRLEGNGHPLEYDIELTSEGGQLVITSETLELDNGQKPGSTTNVFSRKRGDAVVDTVAASRRGEIKLNDTRPLVSGFGVMPPNPAIPRLLTALQNIEVHVPFTTTPGWAARTLRIPPVLRQSATIEPADRLAFGGVNLANAFHALKNEKPPEHWQQTMEYVRLGLGADVQSIDTRVDPGGGQIAIALRRSGAATSEPAFSLSDGMLSYLAFVALYRLEAPTPLLVFDEPEVHLHPSLLGRVLGFFDAISERTNVLLCTHSDRLLDGLDDPAGSAALIELGADRASKILRPDAAVLKEWLTKYGGLGTLRAEGYEAVVFASEPN